MAALVVAAVLIHAHNAQGRRNSGEIRTRRAPFGNPATNVHISTVRGEFPRNVPPQLSTLVPQRVWTRTVEEYSKHAGYEKWCCTSAWLFLVGCLVTLFPGIILVGLQIDWICIVVGGAVMLLGGFAWCGFEAVLGHHFEGLCESLWRRCLKLQCFRDRDVVIVDVRRLSALGGLHGNMHSNGSGAPTTVGGPPSSAASSPSLPLPPSPVVEEETAWACLHPNVQTNGVQSDPQSPAQEVKTSRHTTVTPAPQTQTETLPENLSPRETCSRLAPLAGEETAPVDGEKEVDLPV